MMSDSEVVIVEMTRPSPSEPLILLPEGEMLYQPVYFEQCIPGAINRCLMREGVLARLRVAASQLPKGIRFKIYDAWRPFAVQQSLYDEYRSRLLRKYPELPAQEIDRLTLEFVSLPSRDPARPPLHTTGGAIDLTLVGPDGCELDMGTNFDDFTERAHTDYFERCTENEAVRDHRRLLCRVMCQAGFVNLETEWWHFDFGDRVWAARTGQAAIYQGIFHFHG